MGGNHLYAYIYNNLKLKHGFHFRNHDINRDGTAGTINGKLSVLLNSKYILIQNFN